MQASSSFHSTAAGRTRSNVRDIEREAARLLIRGPSGRVLMLRVAPSFREAFWVTPGGGLDDGETPLDTARRELYEEVGRDDLPIGPLISTRDVQFDWEDWAVTQHEQTFLVEAPDEFEAHIIHPDEEPIVGAAWFSARELSRLGEDVYPEGLIELVESLSQPPVLRPPDVPSG
jgi:8-oxo-dGTP pyrophosphatase MutT (NUDIX family)